MSGERGHHVVRHMPGVDEQRPGHLGDPQPQGGQRLLAVAPCAQLVAAEPRAERAAHAPRARPPPPLPGARRARRAPPRWSVVHLTGLRAPCPPASMTTPRPPPPLTPCTRPSAAQLW